MKPTLSVIVPCYNHGQYLLRCLSAILQQDWKPIEVLVMDDASTDDSALIAGRIAGQYSVVRVVRSERNCGAMATIAKGVEMAEGEYVYIAAADDEILPGLFNRSMRLLSLYPNAALCCAIAEWCEPAPGVSWFMGGGMATDPCYLSPEQLVAIGIKGKLVLVSSTCVHRRDILIRAGNFIQELRWHADWFAVFVTAFRHGVCYVPEVLSRAHLIPGSLYTAGHKRKREHREVLKEMMRRLDSNPFDDVRPMILRSGSLSMFGLPLLWILLSDIGCWNFLTLTYLRRLLWRVAEIKAKRYCPNWLAQRLLCWFYHA